VPTLRVKAIVFDLDGVLVDSSVSVDRQWWAWIDRNGLRERAANVSYHGKRTVDTLREFLDEATAVREAAVIEAAEAADLDGVTIMPGARALVESLPPSAWAVATSGPRALATARLRHAGLPVPGVLVGSEDVSAGKPDPQAYLLAARRLAVGLAPALAIEDAPAGIESARGAGLLTVGLASTHDAAELAAAHYVIESLEQLTVQVDVAGLLGVTLS
jgi:sugar-phosphatase